MELAQVRNRHADEEDDDDDNKKYHGHRQVAAHHQQDGSSAKDLFRTQQAKRPLIRYSSLPSRVDEAPSSDEESLFQDRHEHQSLLSSQQDPDGVPRHSMTHAHVLLLRQPYVSLEQLNPAHECQTRKSTYISALFNLVATVCGGGVLSLPLVFARAGIIPTTLLMIYSAVTTDFSLYLLVACARRTGGRSYGDVAQSAFGSVAQLVTTMSLSTMLLGTLIAYQVLLRDLWAAVLYHFVPSIQATLLHVSEGNSRHADNLLLGSVLVMALPLLLQRDLHALRHTCYVGFSSCVLLLTAVTYRAYQKIQLPHAHQPIKWYTNDPKDIFFAYPIVLLCFFCSFNVLSIHSQLRHPTRQRVRALLDGSMGLCCLLFYAVGLCGYLYAGQDALDNILLNFPMSDRAVLAGRTGYCFTILFGLPLVLLPLREAVIGLPVQVMAWRDDVELIAKYQKVAQEREAGAHLIVNGVDFDSDDPRKFLPQDDPKLRHGARLSSYGATTSAAAQSNTTTASDTMSSIPSLDDTVTTVNSGEDLSLDHHHYPSPTEASHQPQWRARISHLLATVMLLLVTYLTAASVPGVAAVWSIFGSSMAIWVGFIVPTACYLKIREHKGLTIRSCCGGMLLVVSCWSAVVCTKLAIQNAVVS